MLLTIPYGQTRTYGELACRCSNVVPSLERYKKFMEQEDEQRDFICTYDKIPQYPVIDIYNLSVKFDQRVIFEKINLSIKFMITHKQEHLHLMDHIFKIENGKIKQLR